MTKPHPLNVLVVDDERELRASLCLKIQSMGHHATEAESGDEALRIISERQTGNIASIHLILLDVNMPKMSGIEVLREVKMHYPGMMVVIITADGNIRDAVEAMKIGAYNYLEKPVQESDIDELLQQAIESHRLAQEFALSSPTVQWREGEDFIGESEAMKSVFNVIARLGQVNTSVLIRGENGTGKELVARAIHFNSFRKEKPFVAVNCAAIPENLVESEFFGHERGAFTGADSRHIGKFQAAEGGTLFLDEIGEISQNMQVKLLRVLQERRFSPVGSNRELKCDIRVIAATNRNLEAAISQGVFRQDLFYRLNVMPIFLPALRMRKSDIPALVEHFIDKFNRLHDRDNNEIRGICQSALQALQHYHWPGNIRELENFIERAFVLETTNYIQKSSLPEACFTEHNSNISTLNSPATFSYPQETIDFQNQKEAFEKNFIITALKKFEGRINQTVNHAGIPKNTLLRKIRKYGIHPSDYGPVNQDGETE